MLLVALLLAVLVYDLSIVHRLATVQEQVTAAEQRAMTLSLEQQRLLARLEELTRKLFVTRDPDYITGMTDTRQEFEALLGELESLQLSEEGAASVRALAAEWRALPLAALADRAVTVEPDSEEDALLLSSFLELSQALRRQADAVTAVAEQTVADRVRQSAEASRRARTFSWIAAISVVALTLPTLWLTISSIRKPLKRLHEGAELVARGEYDYRIEDVDDGEFADLARNFNDMVRSLDRREQHGRNVLSHLSHELKTPLVAMQETSRLLLDELSGPLNRKQKRLIELNLESSERLADMITKLLDFARMEEGEIDFEMHTGDLVDLARRAVEAFSARAREADVSLALRAPESKVEAICNGNLIMQVLINLLENAIKFSPPGAVVELAVERITGEGRNGGKTAVIEVADSGPGIPPDKREAIFERFIQLEGSQRSGIGLGLAISRQIARAHKGSLTVDENERGGSTFSLMLPLVAVGQETVSGVGA
jgi:two-component system sensor histidine kinase GlrK